MMSDVEFYAEAVTRNEVLGVPVGAPPDAWEAGLGDDFLDDVQRSTMRRDFGLVEIAFTRRGGEWESMTASLQVHRLARVSEGVVPPVLVRAYGEFHGSLRFDELREAVRARGGSLREVTEAPVRGFDHYREARTHASIYVVQEPSHGGLAVGTVWSVVLSRRAVLAQRTEQV